MRRETLLLVKDYEGQAAKRLFSEQRLGLRAVTSALCHKGQLARYYQFSRSSNTQ